ncbi:MAG: hypothetical protein IJF55_01340 [Clostridia bacterium]|nr:hypothetical protein [Clostridia bacterium]
MNISYRKNRNTKKALAFALISLFISALSTAFIFLGAESVILAPPSAFFFALFLDSLYKYVLTDLVYSIDKRASGILFSVYRCGKRSSVRLFECFISDKTEIEKFEKRKHRKKKLLSFQSELFSHDKQLLTLYDDEKEYSLVITVDPSFSLKINEIKERLKDD